MRLLGQFQSSRDVSRIPTQKNAKSVFPLRDLPFKVGNFGGGCVNQLFGLTYIQQRAEPVLLQSVRQLQRLVSGVERSFRNLELKIKLAKLKIGGGDIGDQGRHDLLLRPLIR
jgi:hypothetical protein